MKMLRGFKALYFESDENYDEKELLLKDMVFNDISPEQGSPAWLKARERTIGGSEMAIVRGEDKYKSVKELIRLKCGLDSFNGNKATRWGKLFEPVAIRLVEILFGCHVYQLGIIKGCINGTTFSPDGLAVISNININNLISRGLIKEHKVPSNPLVLFEFKCPFTRIPSSSIPKNYMAQPLSGLSHMKFLDMGYFVDLMFRKCSLEMMTDSRRDEIDLTYHRPNSLTAIGFGIIGVYIDSPDTIDVESIIDFGAPNTMIANEKYLYKYFDIHFAPTTRDVSIFIDYCCKNNYKCVGVLPYKLFKISITPVYRTEGFVEDMEPDINAIINRIDIINSAPDKETKFNEIFN